MNKKGEIDTVVRYGLIAITGIIILLFYNNIQAGINNSMRDKGCWATMGYVTAIDTEFGPFKIKSDLEEACPFYQVNFNDDKGEILKKGKTFQKINYKKLPDKKLNSQKVNEIITDEIANCHQKFSTIPNIFYVPADWIDKYYRWFKKTDIVGCRVCSEINFELENYQEFTGFGEYLNSTKILTKSQKDNSPGEYYYDFIANNERDCNEKYAKYDNCYEGFAKEKGINTNPTFKSDNKYLVVFIREDIRKDEGTVNTYVMSLDTKNRVCKNDLPFFS